MSLGVIAFRIGWALLRRIRRELRLRVLPRLRNDAVAPLRIRALSIVPLTALLLSTATLFVPA